MLLVGEQMGRRRRRRKLKIKQKQTRALGKTTSEKIEYQGGAWRNKRMYVQH